VGRALALSERWLPRIGVFLLPLAFWWDTYDQFVLPKLLLARIFLLGLAAIFIVRTLATNTIVVRRTPIDLPLLALVASAAISTIVAVNPNVSIFGTYARYDGLLTLLTYAGLFWFSAQMLHHSGDARGVIRALLAGGYLVAAIAIYQSISDSQNAGAFVPAFGTLGNSNVLGAFLAMLLPLAYGELVRAQSWSARILALNVLTVVAIALVLTFSRSAWLGALVASAIVLAATPRMALRVTVVTVGVIAIVIVVGGVSNKPGLERLVTARAMTIVDPNAWGSSRLHIWQDSISLIASRPILGYGPDTFGLVFPKFETGDWGVGARDLHQQVDKAHAEVLQIAATQGLIGLAAYLLLLAGFIRAAWRARRLNGLVLFAAFVAYLITVQLNFTALAAALPFWIFAAACLLTWDARPVTVSKALPHGPVMQVAGGIAIAGLAALMVAFVARPYLADRDLQRSVLASATSSSAAAAWAEQARSLAPQESVYAVQAGNLAFEGGHWTTARDAYQVAARLGTYNPMVYRNLALVDAQLGDRAAARAAALNALALDRFDPANQALVAQFPAAGA